MLVVRGPRRFVGENLWVEAGMVHREGSRTRGGGGGEAGGVGTREGKVVGGGTELPLSIKFRNGGGSRIEDGVESIGSVTCCCLHCD